MLNQEENNRKCQHSKENGDQCQAWSMEGSIFCYLHNPAICDEEKKEVMAKGGRGNKPMVKSPLAPIAITNTSGILSLIAATLGELRSGRVDANIAKSIFYGCGCYIKAYEMAVLESKIAETDKRLSEAERLNFYQK